MVRTLLELSTEGLAEVLCWRHGEPYYAEVLEGIASLPEPELAKRVWEVFVTLACSKSCQGASKAAPANLQLRVAMALAPFWQPPRLRLPAGPLSLSHLPSVGGQLQHLDLASADAALSLAPLAACSQLRCLSLRGCPGLTDSSMAPLSACTSLAALDLGGLAQLTDAAASHLPRLPLLAHLNCSGTAFTDGALEMLTYGHRLQAWARAEQQPLPEELAKAWPPLALRVLRATSCHLSPAGLLHLRALPALQLLDVRYTGLPRAALQPLQQRFAGLQLLQGAVLSSSNVLAAVVINHDVVACACSAPQVPETDIDKWAEQGALMLLHSSPCQDLCVLQASPAATEPACKDQQPGQALPVGKQPNVNNAAPAGALGVAAGGESYQTLKRQGYRVPKGERKRPRSRESEQPQQHQQQEEQQSRHGAGRDFPAAPPNGTGRLPGSSSHATAAAIHGPAWHAGQQAGHAGWRPFAGRPAHNGPHQHLAWLPAPHTHQFSSPYWQPAQQQLQYDGGAHSTQHYGPPADFTGSCQPYSAGRWSARWSSSQVALALPGQSCLQKPPSTPPPLQQLQPSVSLQGWRPRRAW